MAKAFIGVYLAAMILLAIAFYLTGLTLESRTFALTGLFFAGVGLMANFLITHGGEMKRKIGGTIWWLGLAGVVGGIVTGAWPLPPAVFFIPDAHFVTGIFTIAVLIAFLVGRQWGPFYAALSFLVVPVLSLFGLIVPMNLSVEMVLGVVGAFVIGIFLVASESLLWRLRKGKQVRASPTLIIRYCLRLAAGGSAFALTLGLLLVPPALLLQNPLSRTIQRIRTARLFAHLLPQGRVVFPETFTMSGGPINLPETPLFQIKGAFYPRWRVRVYSIYTGYGWRVGRRRFLRLSPFPIGKDEVLFSVTETPPLPEVIEAEVTCLIKPVLELPSPGIPLQLRFPRPAPILLLTPGQCLQVSLTRPPVTRYTVIARPVPEKLPPPDTDAPLSLQARRVLTAFPSYLWRVRELAESITIGMTEPYEKATALETFLQTHYRYTDTPPSIPLAAMDVTNFFLFEAREGACDWFASALALMCRALDIPARVVTGFYSTERKDDTLIIRASDAHAWVEAYIDGYGWVTLDATPPANRGQRRSPWWTRLMHRLRRYSRLYLLSPHLLWWLVGFLWAITLAPVAWHGFCALWHRYRPKPLWRVVVDCYLSAVRSGQQVGLPLDPSLTPWENARRCAEMPLFPMHGKRAFQDLADLTVSLLYAEREGDKETVKEARGKLKAFRAALREYVRWFVRGNLTWQHLRSWWESL